MYDPSRDSLLEEMSDGGSSGVAGQLRNRRSPRDYSDMLDELDSHSVKPWEVREMGNEGTSLHDTHPADCRAKTARPSTVLFFLLGFSLYVQDA